MKKRNKVAAVAAILMVAGIIASCIMVAKYGKQQAAHAVPCKQSVHTIIENDELYIEIKEQQAERARLEAERIAREEYERTHPQLWTQQDAAVIAMTMYHESVGSTETESAKVAWCILNRVDNWGGSIIGTASSPNQFAYYGGGIYEGYWYELAVKVLTDWQHERYGEPYEYYGRLIPQSYMWFHGTGTVNIFTSYCPY